MAYPDHSPEGSPRTPLPGEPQLGETGTADESAVGAPSPGFGVDAPATDRGHVDDKDDKKEQAKQVASDAGDRAKDVAGTATEEAVAVKDDAVAAGSDVADTVTNEVGQIAEEAGQQGRRLVDEGKSELQSQARSGQHRLAEMSRSLGGELQSMTGHTDQSGPITDLARNAQHMFDDAANWLEHNEPTELLDSVRRYAARNPWTFLAISAGVGFIGARFVRGLQEPDGARARPAGNVPATDHGNQSATIAPVGDPTYEGGPRYGAEGRVQPGATPGTSFPTVGDTPAGIGQDRPAGSEPHGGARGL